MAPPVVLPVEVIGPRGYVRAVAFDLADGAGVTHLYLKAHRLAYRDASADPGRGPKGSVRLNGGPWLGLDNSTATCSGHEAAFGCLNGAYSTVRLTVPITGARAGRNTLEFRFNGTDGFTSGYRVLALNLLRGGPSGARVLPAGAFAADDPAAWVAPRPSAADVAAGKRLWETAALDDSPLDGAPRLRATCASCHARDGRDLEYFAFSNWSIQERAKFHGLSQTEAEQIASYVRSLRDAEGVGRHGRPWNPPYQPGPGLDARPVEEWAAGAGLDAMLERDVDMAPYLFAGATPRVALARTVNHRELPLSLQLPDWQSWLPEVHPADALGPGNFTGNDYDRTLFGSLDAMHRDVHDAFASGGDGLASLEALVRRVHTDLGQRLQDRGKGDRPAAEKRLYEVQNRSVRHWASVKQWEVMQEYGLEDQGHELRGAGARDRQWLVDARSVFDLSPHRTATFNNYALEHQDRLTGKYFSTAWYELQVVLNDGVAYSERTLNPVDWNYQPSHIDNLYLHVPGPAHPLRLAATVATMLEARAHRTPASGPWGMRQMLPARYAPGQTQGRVLDALPPGLRGDVYDGLLAATMDLFERQATGDWQRTDPAAPHRRTNDHQIEPASYQIQPFDPSEMDLRVSQGRWADSWYVMVPLFRDAGVSEATLTRAIDWGATVWPENDWDALRAGPRAGRPPAGIAPGVYVVRARHSGRVLDVAGVSTRDGATVHQWDDAGGANQRWQFRSVDGEPGTFTLVALHSSKCLDLEAGRTDNGADVLQRTCDGRRSQRWRVEPVAGRAGSYHVVAAAGGRVLDVAGRSQNNGANVQLWGFPSESTGAAHRQWTLEAVAQLLATPQATVSETAEQAAPLAVVAFPNPTRGTAQVQLTLGSPGPVRVDVFDVLGRSVMTLVDGDLRAGTRSLQLDASALSPGVYVLRAQTESETSTHHLSVVR